MPSLLLSPTRTASPASRPALGILLLCALVIAVTSPQPSHAQPQRLLPPEPSREAWVGAAQIRAMEHTAATYRGIVAAGGWPRLPDQTALKPGDRHRNVALLRRQLEMTGDLAPAGGGSADLFDTSVEAAVRRYQRRHGIQPTGAVHEITHRALAVPADARLHQIELNLDRIEELLPKLTGPRYLLMNGASFELQGISGGRVEVTSRTVIGKRTTPTPVLSATVQAINLLPYWHVPSGIARRSVIPAIRKDPSYLYRERIRVFSTFGGEEIDPARVNWWGPEAERYAFRQEPGPNNALGVIRFDMPNKYVVYLHDSPAKDLYDRFERAYSSGCIRTQHYLDVAEWALAGQGGWTRAGLQSGIESGRNRTIKLEKPIPIHLIYLTAWVEDGAIHFRNDLYNRDKTVSDRRGRTSGTDWGVNALDQGWTTTTTITP